MAGPERAPRTRRVPPGVGAEGVRAAHVYARVVGGGAPEQSHVHPEAGRGAVHAVVEGRRVRPAQDRPEAETAARDPQLQDAPVRPLLDRPGRAALDPIGPAGGVFEARHRVAHRLVAQQRPRLDGQHGADARLLVAFQALEDQRVHRALVHGQGEAAGLGIEPRGHPHRHEALRLVVGAQAGRDLLGIAVEAAPGLKADPLKGLRAGEEGHALEDDLAQHRRGVGGGSGRVRRRRLGGEEHEEQDRGHHLILRADNGLISSRRP